MWNGTWKREMVNPDNPDQDNGTKLLNYFIAIGPGQKVCAACHSRRKSIADESPTSFSEDTAVPYSRFNSLGYKPLVISTILAGRTYKI
ncbi:hypothetical protein TNCV_3507421 [Trichonephila clavipes]|uniref:Uncharacterized protein n=1 Tax=Trichonephila clavipes TaxID=2585209 RepID=A0A8X6S4R5_TRICX|nr:hypothetical protein TNCV_3507421 [Trichonephila clavipes]